MPPFPLILPSCTQPFHRFMEEGFLFWRRNSRGRTLIYIRPQTGQSRTFHYPHPSACPALSTPRCWNWIWPTVSTEWVSDTRPSAPLSTTGGETFWVQAVVLTPVPHPPILENPLYKYFLHKYFNVFVFSTLYPLTTYPQLFTRQWTYYEKFLIFDHENTQNLKTH